MTQEELDALPEQETGFGMTTENRVCRPTLPDNVGALYQGDADGMFRDENGVWWMTGWRDGVRMKVRA